MEKSRIPKKFKIFLLALIITGLFFIFELSEDLLKDIFSPEDKLLPEIKKDKIPPSTAVTFPGDKSWHNTDFVVKISDSDLGSGLVDFKPGKAGCRYIIEDLGTGAVSGGFRRCGSAEIAVPVGENKICSSSYSKENISFGKCKVSTKAFDRAGNDSGWKSKVFNIDLIKPKVKAIELPRDLELNQTYLLEAIVSDNNKLIGCHLFVNGINVKETIEIKPIPCENETECQISVNYFFDFENDYYLRFGCFDNARNFSYGEQILAKVLVNHRPEIAFCRVKPIQGNTETSFAFEVNASDSDNDTLFYYWDFGDGNSSDEQNPSHFYLSSGTYEPKVSVIDKKGGEIICSTAWVVVIE